MFCETELVADWRGRFEPEVIIIGAGVAGLATLAELDKAGVSAICLEARDRIGGRILTIHDPGSPIPIELGAEFIHGRPPETWGIIERCGLGAYDCTEDAVRLEAGTIADRPDAWLPLDDIMSAMERAAATAPDRSFAAFLAETAYPEVAKRLAASYVQGFNAAHDDRIGIASLALDSRAAKAIDGDRVFRLVDGYDAIPALLLSQVKNPGRATRLNSIVEGVRWRKGSAAVAVRSSVTGRRGVLECGKVVITVPLGVLQAGTITFDPIPTEHLEAARELCFGQVFRVVLRFTERFWERNEELAEAGFLLSDEAVFPTWWTALPFRAPVITGWSAGRKADPLLGRGRECVVSAAIEKLATITSVDPNEAYSLLAAAHFHDWSIDPFARGAYSYVPPGGLQARELLAQPVEGTLYFSGEATETNGHGATVHGAIASGRRAARDILR